VLGPWAAILAMTSILVVQCLLFQDGGLLALGCNILNMGVVPCLAGWGIYRLLLGDAQAARPRRQYLAAWAACVLGVASGAALVPVQASLSGVLRVPTGQFLAVMTGVHLLIGFVEGLITFLVIAYLRQVRPAALGLAAADAAGGRLSRGMVVASLAVTAALLAGVVSWFASSYPDGLEWSYLEHRYDNAGSAVAEPSGTVAAVTSWQTKWSPMTDYTKRAAPLGEEPKGEGEATSTSAVNPWGSLAGLIGTAVTLAIVYAAALLLRRRTPAHTH
jgi:cobalt/nickel transport system permease protein